MKNILIQPKILVLIFFVTAIAAISSAFIELNQSKVEMYELMNEQGHSILETVLISASNALVAYDKIENELKTRLLNNAETIKLLNGKDIVTDQLLGRMAKQNNLYRINIFDTEGKKIFSSHMNIHNLTEEINNPIEYLRPIFSGEVDTIIIGLKPARHLSEQRYAVALATADRKAIVVNINADQLLNFRKEVGFGVLLKKVTENSKIIYAALQDEKGIIAGSGKIDQLENFQNDKLIIGSLNEATYKSRVLKSDSVEVFEVIRPFIHEGKTIGIFRLGLSLEPLNKIEERLTRRIITISIILFIFGFITITLIFLRQNFSALSKRFNAVESYSTRIVDNVSDGIVVLNSTKQITLINKSAKIILNVADLSESSISFETLFHSNCDEFWSSPSRLQEINCDMNGNPKTFLFSLSEFSDEAKAINYVIVFRDLTEQKLLEQQSVRNEKMIAMGELASSVAHEIRNPLNSIGTIAQQLGKDFEVKENENEFKSLTSVVYSEVKRINETIESFLQFAKPQQLNPEDVSIQDLSDEIVNQYTPLLLKHRISFSVALVYNGTIRLDRSQMKQVLINLIENSIAAITEKGVISLSVAKENSLLKIILADNGKGIEADRIDKVFDLYFTSKKKGNGIGLSIVHKIVTAHGGTISVSSLLNEGTQFIIKLPLQSS